MLPLVTKWVFLSMLAQMWTVKMSTSSLSPLLPHSEMMVTLSSLEGQDSNTFECFSPWSFLHFILCKSRETDVLLTTWPPAPSLSAAPTLSALTQTEPVTLPVLQSTPLLGSGMPLSYRGMQDDYTEAAAVPSVRCTSHIHHRPCFHVELVSGLPWNN